MEKKKILFVDDEPYILSGLRRMLRPLRDMFDLQFAEGGPEALKLLEAERFDVIVSDMRMPDMDGAELLRIVQQKYPHTIRIMLTGQAEEKSIFRTVGVAHQFLTKPCEPESLRSVLLQASALQNMLSDGLLKDLISQIGTLPGLPATYAKLQQALTNPEVTIKQLGAIIAQDISMTVKILQLVNSSFFGVYSQVTTPERAVSLLGLETVKVLVLSIELFSTITIPKELFSIEKLWEHSLIVGRIAREFTARYTDDQELINTAFLAGTLHDLGKLILLSSLPNKYRQAIDIAQEQNITLSEAEISVFGVSQSVVGAYLVGLWGFTPPIIGFH